MQRTPRLAGPHESSAGATVEQFFDLSLDLLCIVSVDGVLLRVNPAFTNTLGWTTRDLVSRSCLDFLHPADHARAARKDHTGVRSAPPGEYRWRCINGSYKWLAWMPTVDENGLTYAVAHDLTKWRELEAQLRQAQKMGAIGQLAGSVAHDLNNILTVIHGCSDFLTVSLSADDSSRADLDLISDAAGRAATLTRQLLASSRNPALPSSTVDLNACIVDLQPMLRRIVGKNSIIATDLASDLGCVSADVAQLEQVIVNMTANARDAMPHGGELRLATSNCVVDEVHTWLHTEAEPGPHVLLSISDTGCGMDDAKLSHVLETIVATEEPRDRTGLATAYEIIRQSSGHITVTSTPGAGTTFSIYIPIVKVPPTAPPQSDNAPLVCGTETILLVEDDSSVRALAGQALTRHGYGVIEAANGAEGLDTVRAWGGKIDLVITDAVMPVMNGGELAEILAAEYPRIRLLFISLYTNDEIVRRGVDSRRAFLPKPFRTNDLTQKVREVLDACREEA